ncbi:MAG: FAD-dependent oxidoreductase [Sulfobacillus sp.]|nr:FAD-dependent oxidoreductase [Sulfobacillus sp.]
MTNRLPDRVAVAGGGPAGLAAALWAARLGYEVILFEKGARLGGQLHQLSLPLVDVPGFTGSAAELAHRLESQLSQWPVTIYRSASVVAYDVHTRRLVVDGQTDREAAWLFYAPGLRTRRLEVPGAHEVVDYSVSDYLARKRDNPAVVVVGGGDRAAEAALRLAEAGLLVRLIHRGAALSARPSYRARLAALSVPIFYHTVVRAILRQPIGYRVEGEGPLGSVAWDVDQVFIRIGMEPAIDDRLARLEGGVAVPAHPGISVIGDAALPSWQHSIVSAWASAMQTVKHWSRR